MFSSLRGRLFSSTVIILVIFLGGTAWGLIRAFTTSIEKGAEEQLQLHVYSLLSAANESGGRLSLPEALQEPRFNVLSSGLYGAVASDDTGFFWRSASSVGVDLGTMAPLSPGQTQFSTVLLDADIAFYRLGFGVVWEGDGGVEHRYTFVVMESVDRYQAQLDAFQDVLWQWLLALGAILLVSQWVVMQWGLSPMATLAQQVALIEAGKTQQLEGRFPKEISPVVNNLNQLVSHEHRQRERYKNTLGDLAHSLKTPLAVLRGAREQEESLPDVVERQVDRMNQIVEYQLKRAVASRAVQLGKLVCIEQACQKLLATLDKVYRDKGVNASIHNDLESAQRQQFVGDEADLLEVMGNLLDNAYKHCQHTVQVHIVMKEGSEREGVIRIEDDGAGIPEALRQQVLHRGVRADTATSGQGIGMAVVHDVVTGYQGDVSIMSSTALGGTSIHVQLPCRITES